MCQVSCLCVHVCVCACVLCACLCIRTVKAATPLLGAVSDTSVSGLMPVPDTSPCSTSHPLGMSTERMGGALAVGLRAWDHTHAHTRSTSEAWLAIGGMCQQTRAHTHTHTQPRTHQPHTHRYTHAHRCNHSFTCSMSSKGGLGVPLKLNPNIASTMTSY